MEEWRITVINLDTNVYEIIDLYEVDYVEVVNKKIIYHITNKTYAQISSLAELTRIFTPEQGFDSLDRPNIVNLKKIRRFDKTMGKVYFEEYPNKSSVYATVAKIKYPFVEIMITRFTAINNDKSIEVKPQKKGLKNLLKGMVNTNL